MGVPGSDNCRRRTSVVNCPKSLSNLHSAARMHHDVRKTFTVFSPIGFYNLPVSRTWIHWTHSQNLALPRRFLFFSSGCANKFEIIYENIVVSLGDTCSQHLFSKSRHRLDSPPFSFSEAMKHEFDAWKLRCACAYDGVLCRCSRGKHLEAQTVFYRG